MVSTRGTTPLAALRAAEEKGIIGGARILEGKDHDESFAMLERGEAQAFAMDDILLYSLRATSKDPKRWAVVGEFITVEPLAIMLRKDDPEFKKYVDTVLSRAMIDGEVALPLQQVVPVGDSAEGREPRHPAVAADARPAELPDRQGRRPARG